KSPRKGGPQPRVSSPRPGRSSLMTSAPRSARSCPQNGPASTRAASSTRTPASGPAASAIPLIDLAFATETPGKHRDYTQRIDLSLSQYEVLNVSRTEPIVADAIGRLKHGCGPCRNPSAI